MRTTLTSKKMSPRSSYAEVRTSGKPLKQVLNEKRREAFARSGPKNKISPFEVNARPMGLRPGLSLDCISALIEQVEGPFYR